MKLKGRTGGSPSQRRGPLRKIVERLHYGATIFEADWVRLECGHETLSNGIYKARCQKCFEENIRNNEEVFERGRAVLEGRS